MSHQCRTFERERCGVVYRGHTALVTRVAWRIAGEDVSSIFLSAALDDTVRVWYLDKSTPVCVLRLTEVRLAMLLLPHACLLRLARASKTADSFSLSRTCPEDTLMLAGAPGTATSWRQCTAVACTFGRSPSPRTRPSLSTQSWEHPARLSVLTPG